MELFNCICCGKVFNTIDNFSGHLKVHLELSEQDQKELIKDVLLIKENNNKKLVKRQLSATRKLLSEKAHYNNIKALEKHKNKIGSILLKYGFEYKYLDKINKFKTINKLNSYIINNLDVQLRQTIIKNGIDLKVSVKSKSRKRKVSKDYNDCTRNSIRILYTPMGNKR